MQEAPGRGRGAEVTGSMSSIAAWAHRSAVWLGVAATTSDIPGRAATLPAVRPSNVAHLLKNVGDRIWHDVHFPGAAPREQFDQAALLQRAGSRLCMEAMREHAGRIVELSAIGV